MDMSMNPPNNNILLLNKCASGNVSRIDQNITTLVSASYLA
uniref:Uncharacterized protein n=1 Tax=Picea glauca TaxID=3330 RepID=A0A101M449_PICGL|nr:hypothetical protein ABT39_MTgene570 [Picea glauca]